MTRIDISEVMLPTPLSQSNISAAEDAHSVVTTQQLPVATDAQPFSIVLFAAALLAALLGLALLTLAIVLLCRCRKLRSNPGKRGFPQLPPGMESEFDMIQKSYREKFDVLFDKKELQKSSKRNKKPAERSDEKCQLCLDRGHILCQGHSLSRSSSFGGKDKKNLTFLIPSGYYEHVSDQTDTTLVDTHVYSKLSDDYVIVPGVATEQYNPYNHLSQATSGQPLSNQEAGIADGGYDVPNYYYEELPAADAVISPSEAADELSVDEPDSADGVICSGVSSETHPKF